MVAVNDLVTSIALNTVWLVMLYQLDARVILPARFGARLLTLPIYSTILLLVARAYRRSEQR